MLEMVKTKHVSHDECLGNTGIYGSLKGSLREPLDCHGWVLDETQNCRCSPFQYRLFAEVWTSGGSPEEDRGAEAQFNGQTLCFGASEQMWIQR